MTTQANRERIPVGTSFWVERYRYEVVAHTADGYRVLLSQFAVSFNPTRREHTLSRDFLEREYGRTIAGPLARQHNSAAEHVNRTVEVERLEARLAQKEENQEPPCI